MTSNFLYEHRFGPYFVEPVIAGLTPDTFEPYICQMDFIGKFLICKIIHYVINCSICIIGCKSESVDFVVSGTCTEQLYGMCETLYEPDMLPDDLFEIISQAMMNAFDRDAGSGWGATVHIL